MKIALAMICKGTPDEAALLERCLESVAPHVDGVFVLSTHKPGQPECPEVRAVAHKFGGHSAPYEWKSDFADARNASFACVPAEYDYILWCDADDVWRGLSKLKAMMEENPADAYAFHYLYDFDEVGEPRVTHVKTMLVRNDGSFTWKGRIHEDLIALRDTTTKLVAEVIDRLHLTSGERVETAKARNLEIAELNRQANPDDPRARFVLAQSALGAGDKERGIAELETFVSETGSRQDKFLALTWLATACEDSGDRDRAEAFMERAIGCYPSIPDGYLGLGRMYRRWGRNEDAELYLIQGLVRKKHVEATFVSNPRDYDRNTMQMLAEIYIEQGRADKALPMLEGVIAISPDLPGIAELVAEMRKEKAKLEQVAAFCEEIKTLPVDEQRVRILEVPEDLRSHPMVCYLWNQLFIREETDGKEVAYFCGLTTFEWGPHTFREKGVGGSEEAVIHLSRQWARKGYRVTVFNNCGTAPVVDPEAPNVTYKPFWMFNRRDRWDVLILWRRPNMVDYPLNAGTVLVDLHDVVAKEEFTEARLKKIDRVLVKTKCHRRLFPNIPDEKVAIIPNGLDLGSIPHREKEQKLAINTSSPDRSMDVLPALWKRVRAQVPEARLVWMYGFDILLDASRHDKAALEWVEKLKREIGEAGIESLGKVPQHVALEWYARANVLAYPTEFMEIDCISVKKAQAAGCLPVTTDFGALAESNARGVKVHSPKTDEDWNLPYQRGFGLSDPAAQDAWVAATVKALSEPVGDRTAMREFGASFDWPLTADKWIPHFTTQSSTA